MSGRSPGPGRSRKGSQAGSQAGSHDSPGPTTPPPGHQRCQLLLHNTLAITLRRACAVPCHPTKQIPIENDFWMYDNGYLLFQGFVEANGRCFWSAALLEAMRELQFAGYVAPGVLLVRAGACALDVVRTAWARRVLKPPPNYVITTVGDMEDCIVVSVPQGQFTPLPEALCWVILELTSAGQAAVLPSIQRALPAAFPAMTRPETTVLYDALAKLSTERKVYQTSQGYFLVTPETRRRRLQTAPSRNLDSMDLDNTPRRRRSMLLSNEEAMIVMHGDMHTERDGHITHQCIQTNLADVICGGNANDKILYPRMTWKRLERRHSLRLGSSRRLSASLQRCGSVRALPCRSEASDSSSAASCPEQDQIPDPPPEKKVSLLARLFRRSGRRGRRGQSAPPAPHIRTFSAQFPPAPSEWFNQGVATLASVATQTQTPPSSSSTLPLPRRAGSPAPRNRHSSVGWDCTDNDFLDRPTSRASTLPRRHRRRDSLSGGSQSSKSPSVSRSASRSSPSKSSATTLCSIGTAIHHPDPKTLKAAFLNVTHKPPCPSPKTSPSNTLLSSASSRASTSGMSKASSGYNSSAGTSRRSNASGSPSRKSLPGDTRRPPLGKPSTPPTSNLPQDKSSFTLQVSTTNNGSASQPLISKSSPSTSSTTTTTTTTINGTNSTKIYVQQENSPVRSVITFENRSNKAIPHNIHDKEIIVMRAEQNSPSSVAPIVSFSVDQNNSSRPKLERPSSLCSPGELIKSGFGGTKPLKKETLLETSFDRVKSPSVEDLSPCETNKYSNKINNHNLSSNKQVSSSSSFESLTSAGSLMNESDSFVCRRKEVVEMNNSRKFSLPGQGFPIGSKIRESLSYKNILKEVFSSPDIHQNSLKNLCSLPGKPFDGILSNFGDSVGNVHKDTAIKKLATSTSLEKEIAELGSVPIELCPYSSLGDLSVHFKSLAAQKILSGVSINSVDTLVEVNMAAAEKKNNCDVAIHTDFGLV